MYTIFASEITLKLFLITDNQFVILKIKKVLFFGLPFMVTRINRYSKRNCFN